MRALVTGGAGYIGSFIVRDLLDAGWDVVVLDNLSTGNRWAVPKDALVEGDIRNPGVYEKLRARFQFDAIIHMAAMTVVPDSMNKPLTYFDVDAFGTMNLLRFAVNEGIENFVFSSTAAVYGEPEQQLVSEHDSTQPISPYGQAKLHSEEMIRAVSLAHGLKYATLRYFNVAGAHPSGMLGQATEGATHLIKVLSEVAIGVRDKFFLYGNDYPTEDGTCVRDYIHVMDLSAAHLDSLRYLLGGGSSFTANCGYGRGFSVREVVDEFERLIGRSMPMYVMPRRDGDSARVVADPSLLSKLVGWQPRHAELRKIVRSALEWERYLRGAQKPSGG